MTNNPEADSDESHAGSHVTSWAGFVKIHRTAARMPKLMLAAVLEVDRATVMRWETGTSRPERPEVVLKLAEVLGVDPDDALVAAGLLPPLLANAPSVSQPQVIARLAELLQDPRTPADARDAILSALSGVAAMAERLVPDQASMSTPPSARTAPRRRHATSRSSAAADVNDPDARHDHSAATARTST
jgi:transcriptional regulator with XRE-family HTH domain